MNPLALEGEWGFNIQLNTDFDMSARTPSFMFGLPDSTRVEKNAVAVTALSDGDLEYLVEDGFLVEGKWNVQIVLTTVGGILKGPIHHFTIGPPNEAT